jgi:hypothetical protein
MATTSPTRIDDDLYASAKLAGDVQSRSASQQIAHWARIGREIEASGSISHRHIAEVLANRRSYDGLDTEEQAVVRAVWAERMAAYRSELDLAQRFSVEGRTWVELDDDGHVVERRLASAEPASTGGAGAQRRVTTASRPVGRAVVAAEGPVVAKGPAAAVASPRSRRQSSGG